MSVKVKYKGAEIASANTNVTKVLKTSGKYCEDDISIINTQDGGGGGGFFHETGEMSYHTGSKLRTITIPISDDSYDRYIVRVKAIASWLLVGGEWVEQDGVDFTGAVNENYAIYYLVVFTDGFGAVPIIKIDGTSGAYSEIYAISRRGAQTNTSPLYSGYDAPTISEGEIKLSLGSGNNLCTATWGLTYEYEVWGFNN